MIMVVVHKAKPGLKGKISRWLSEIDSGVYLGTLSARVREKLWHRIEQEIGEGGATMVYSDQTEQGYTVKTTGQPAYRFRDFEGLVLAQRPKSP